VIFQIENAYEIPQGTWTIKINGLEIIDGSFDIWLPTLDEVTSATAFLLPSPQLTVTLPACARKVISVGGYDTSTGGIAPFSGRGRGDAKPELCAPAVNVESAKAGGGYGRFTGTSFAAPYVTGSAALIMQWGIVNGNDPFLYGQRVKAFLQRGAARDANMTYPNNIWGYGKLCVKRSMEYLEEYK
jgi:hypothetical protein